jgi:hypothetical protein
MIMYACIPMNLQMIVVMDISILISQIISHVYEFQALFVQILPLHLALFLLAMMEPMIVILLP